METVRPLEPAPAATGGRAAGPGPVWLLLGTAIFVLVRRAHGERLFQKVQPAVPDLVPAPQVNSETPFSMLVANTCFAIRQ